MAEILGIVTGSLQLLDTGLKALEYVKDFLQGPEEQRKLVAEMATLKPMLVELEKRIRANPSSHTLEQMKEPLLTFKTALGLVMSRARLGLKARAWAWLGRARALNSSSPSPKPSEKAWPGRAWA
ncbi:hypothetical protein C8R45DRAFT_1081230 [Mycena sanguinolenta]|nr:hypothetical protein C8R45DRAFT_1081230 [Mycena sanguinolenta]